MELVRRIAKSGTTLILITHHIDEIVPEIARVVLLRDGRILADGSKQSMLTPSQLSRLFGAHVAIEDAGGYFYAHLENAERQ
jgi:iron complex transport system ATP-binding protein